MVVEQNIRPRIEKRWKDDKVCEMCGCVDLWHEVCVCVCMLCVHAHVHVCVCVCACVCCACTCMCVHVWCV